MSSTVRVVICGFVAKPSATRKPAALPCPPYVPRAARPCVHTATLGVGPPPRSGTPWSDCRQAYALAGTSPTYLRVLSVSRGFDRWARSCTTNSFSRMIIHSLATKNTVAGPKSATLLRVVLLRGLLRTSGGYHEKSCVSASRPACRWVCFKRCICWPRRQG